MHNVWANFRETEEVQRASIALSLGLLGILDRVGHQVGESYKREALQGADVIRKDVVESTVKHCRGSREGRRVVTRSR